MEDVLKQYIILWRNLLKAYMTELIKIKIIKSLSLLL